MAAAIVFAVYMPPQAPASGQAWRMICYRWPSFDRAGEKLPVALKRRDDVELLAAIAMSGADGAPIDHEREPIEPGDGHHTAGHVLVAAGIETLASYRCAAMTVSLESAIRSRDCNKNSCRRCP
jgi:hypothetical protein